MSRTVRILTGVLMMLTVLLTITPVLTGVVFLDGIRLQHHATRTFTVGPRPLLIVRGDVADITVVAGSPGQVVVEQDVHAQALTRGLAELTVRNIIGAVSATDTTVDVRADRFFCCTTSSWVSDVGASLFVRLPPDASVDVGTRSGRVALTGVTATGSVRVRTDSGSVDFSGALHGGRLVVQTSTGDIRLGLPSDTSARLSAATETGDITVDRTWPLAASSRAVGGTLGDGTNGAIRLQTSSGSISIGAR
jgi:hypothetical protein